MSTFDFLRAERQKARDARDVKFSEFRSLPEHSFEKQVAGQEHKYLRYKIDVITDLIGEYQSQAIEEFNAESI
jgi:hypothetical protein